MESIPPFFFRGSYDLPRQKLVAELQLCDVTNQESQVAMCFLAKNSTLLVGEEMGLRDLPKVFEENVFLGGGNSIFFFTPIPGGDDPIWRIFFQTGWFNHQVVLCFMAKDSRGQLANLWVFGGFGRTKHRFLNWKNIGEQLLWIP